MPKRKTKEEFYKQTNEKCPNIKILTEYTKVSDNYLCECKICGYQWTTNGLNITRGKTGCKECYKNNKRLTHNDFLERLVKITDSVIPLDVYFDKNTKMKFRCKICDHIWKAAPFNILRGNGCPECAKEKLNTPKKTHKQFIEQVNVLNPNITILGEYIGAKERVLCKCNICGFEWNPLATSVLSGFGCPKCSGRYKTTEEFKKEIYFINPNIEILSEYINATTMMKCKCKICEHVWEAKANNLRHKGCPQCNNSHGENNIKKYLKDRNISFIPQYKFSGLKGVGGKLLSYDFYLPSYNLLIEFQGKQHDKPIEHFGGEQQLKIQQEHDERKRNYAKLHNINLLEIWYYDIDNIEKILIKELIKLNKINNLNLESVETVTVA